MSAVAEVIKMKPDVNSLHNRLIVGISGSSLKLVNFLSDYYSLPPDIDLHDRVLKKSKITEWTFESLMAIFKETLDEIEVSLVVNSSGLIINYTPVDMISLLLLNMNQMNLAQDLTQENMREIESLIDKAITLCNRFTHFVQVFPGGTNRNIKSDLKANLKAGIYHRYYEKVGCCVISVPELVVSVEDQFDFITRVINLLEKL